MQFLGYGEVSQHSKKKSKGPSRHQGHVCQEASVAEWNEQEEVK